MRAPALGAAIVAALALPATARPEAVTIQANPAHTGFVASGGPAPPLTRRWTARLDGAVGYPVIGDGKAFIVTTFPLPRGPRVVALSLRDGRRLWSRELGAPSLPSSAALAYDAGRLIVTRNVYGGDPEEGAMLALSAENGDALWETDDLTLFEAVPPVVVDGVVYLSETGGGAGGVSAWRVSDGTSLWRVSTHQGGGGSAAVAGDTVFTQIGCPPEVFRVRRDGTPLVPTSSDCTSGGGGTPVVSDSRVLLWGSDSDSGVFDAATGARLGSLHSDYAPAVGHGLMLLVEAHTPGEPVFRGHTLIARRMDGRVAWRFRGDGYLDSAPLIAGRWAFVGSGSGRLYALDARTGRVRSRTDAGASVLSHLAAGEGLLLVPARGRLVAFG
jgi:outer membrane protein assembly factor BamB